MDSGLRKIIQPSRVVVSSQLCNTKTVASSYDIVLVFDSRAPLAIIEWLISVILQQCTGIEYSYESGLCNYHKVLLLSAKTSR